MFVVEPEYTGLSDTELMEVYGGEQMAATQELKRTCIGVDEALNLLEDGQYDIKHDSTHAATTDMLKCDTKHDQIKQNSKDCQDEEVQQTVISESVNQQTVILAEKSCVLSENNTPCSNRNRFRVREGSSKKRFSLDDQKVEVVSR